jgi:hypothetical protein
LRIYDVCCYTPIGEGIETANKASVNATWGITIPVSAQYNNCHIMRNQFSFHSSELTEMSDAQEPPFDDDQNPPRTISNSEEIEQKHFENQIAQRLENRKHDKKKWERRRPVFLADVPRDIGIEGAVCKWNVKKCYWVAVCLNNKVYIWDSTTSEWVDELSLNRALNMRSQCGVDRTGDNESGMSESTDKEGSVEVLDSEEEKEG